MLSSVLVFQGQGRRYQNCDIAADSRPHVGPRRAARLQLGAVDAAMVQAGESGATNYVMARAGILKDSTTQLDRALACAIFPAAALARIDQAAALNSCLTRIIQPTVQPRRPAPEPGSGFFKDGVRQHWPQFLEIK